MAATGYTTPANYWGSWVPTLWNPPTRRSRFGNAMLVVFLLTQCFDGIFTYVGVMTFGIEIEANPVISGLMVCFGEAAGLLGAKIVAAVLGIALHLSEVHGAVALLAAFYMAIAVLPWTAILFL